MIKNKTCSECKYTGPKSDFIKHRRLCRPCSVLRVKRWKEKQMNNPILKQKFNEKAKSKYKNLSDVDKKQYAKKQNLRKMQKIKNKDSKQYKAQLQANKRYYQKKKFKQMYNNVIEELKQTNIYTKKDIDILDLCDKVNKKLIPFGSYIEKYGSLTDVIKAIRILKSLYPLIEFRFIKNIDNIIILFCLKVNLNVKIKDFRPDVKIQSDITFLHCLTYGINEVSSNIYDVVNGYI